MNWPLPFLLVSRFSLIPSPSIPSFHMFLFPFSFFEYEDKIRMRRFFFPFFFENVNIRLKVYGFGNSVLESKKKKSIWLHDRLFNYLWQKENGTLQGRWFITTPSVSLYVNWGTDFNEHRYLSMHSQLQHTYLDNEKRGWSIDH